MRPGSTYRLQLRSGFDFGEAARVVPYLSRLGITDLYSSPFLQAAPGSTHGYDIVDSGGIDPELGGPEGFRSLVSALSAHRMGHIADIVPNHMSTVGRDNRWWWDVLENGPSSPFARYFDIDWRGPDQSGAEKVLAPILADHYGRVLENGEITIERDVEGLIVRYYEHELPLSPRTYGAVLGAAGGRNELPELIELARAFDQLPVATPDDRRSAERLHTITTETKGRLDDLCRAVPSCASAVDAEVALLSKDPDRLDELLLRQHYRLAFWRSASELLDYRRFFSIVSLVGLRVEDEEVFARSHRLIVQLLHEGSITGLRVDHVDGLRQPAQYLHRLRAASGGAYTVVEKILAPHERLPGSWPVEGTTGYEFLNRVNGLFVDSANEAALTSCYQQFTGDDRPYAEVVRESKAQVLEEELLTEVERLSRILYRLCGQERRHRDRTYREVHDALVQVIVDFPVYRSYAEPDRPAGANDRHLVEDAVKAAVARRPDVDPELLAFVGDVALLCHPGEIGMDFALRFAQLTAPAMAKGAEDTAFYRYNRLLSLNEVGGAPELFGRHPSVFHEETSIVAGRWPQTMLTLSTHDTKRSADVRARINLLSELPDAWSAAIERFAELNETHRRDGWPDRVTEYAIYQTLVGAWPMSADRLAAYARKAIREAKVHTSWADPHHDYEDAVDAFARAIVADRRFVDELELFLAAERVVELGRVNSLAQTTLLLTCPGVADLYQGNELWDLSLVDPDNRRPVDFDFRQELLDTLTLEPPTVSLADDHQGVWKLWLTGRLLELRRQRRDIFEAGEYAPIDVAGSLGHHAIAFERRDVAVVVPRLLRGLNGGWQDATVELGRGRWTNVLTGEAVASGRVAVADLTGVCPVAVLTRADA